MLLNRTQATKFIVAVTVAIITCPALAANDLQYNVKNQQNAANFKQLTWVTRSCMNERARFLLHQGVRDSELIIESAQKFCGNTLLNFMKNTLKKTDVEASSFIQALAYDELNQIPGLSRHNKSPAPDKKLETGKPVVLNRTTDGVMIATLKGNCTQAIIRDAVTNSGLCSPMLFNVQFPNGRVGFGFTLDTEQGLPLVFSFSGNGSQQVDKDKDHATQPIDRLTVTFNEKNEQINAVGKCEFSNPYKKRPVKILCTADTPQGMFVGEFISDGTSPVITKM